MKLVLPVSLASDLELRLRELAARAIVLLDADVAFIATRLLARQLAPHSRGPWRVAASSGLSFPAHEQLDRLLSGWSPSQAGGDQEGGITQQQPALLNWLDRTTQSTSHVLLPLGEDAGFFFIGRRDEPRLDDLNSDVLALLSDTAGALIEASLARTHAEARDKELHAFQEISEAITKLGSVNRVLSRICHKATALLEVEMAYVALADESQQRLRMCMSKGIRNPRWHEIGMAFGEGIGGWVADRRESIILSSPTEWGDRVVEGVRKLVDGESIHSVICVPMQTGGQVMGVLYVASRQPAHFSAQDARLLQGLADQAAIAIANSRLYDRQSREVEAHDRLTSIVLHGGDFASLAEAMHGLVQKPVALYDQHQSLLACYPPSLATDFRREVVDFKETLRSTEDEANLPIPSGGMAGMVLPPATDARVCCARAIGLAASGEEILGYVHVLQFDGTLDAHDLRLAEKAGVVLALRLMRERVEAEVEQRLRGDLLDDLLSENIQTAEAALRRSAHLGHALGGAQVILVVDIRDFGLLVTKRAWSEGQAIEARQRLFQQVTRSLEVARIDALVDLKSDRVVGLLCCPDHEGSFVEFAESLGQTLTERLATRLPQLPVLIGLGSVAANVRDIGQSYQEALLCLRVAKRLSPGPSFTTYDQLGMLGLLLDSSNPGRVAHFVEVHLGRLMEHDQRRNANLVGTLACYLDQSCNKAETARRLNMHLNTLKYRLARIVDISGLDLDDPETRFQAHIAARALLLEQAITEVPAPLSDVP